MSAVREPLSKKLSLKQQIIGAFCCGMVMLIVISTVLLAKITHRTLSAYAESQGRIITENLAQESALAFLYDSQDIAEKVAQATLAFPSVQHIALYRSNHQVFYKTGESSASIVNHTFDGQLHEDDDAWFFFEPISVATEEASDSPFASDVAQEEVLGYVVVTMSKEALQTIAARIFLSNASVIGGVSLGLLIIILMVTHRLTQPLQSLISIMRRAQSGQLGVRADSQGPSDIVVMQKAFNQMMEEIEDREEELIVTRDAALESARIKATFAATVSHELRTPMNGVLGMLQLIELTELSEQARDFTRTAMSSAKDLLRLIDDVLDFSKMESGKIVLHSEVVSLRKLGNDIVELLGFQAKQKHLLLTFIIDRDVPDQVVVDIVRLRQVLVNLIGNAIKFTHEGHVVLHVYENELTNPPVLAFAVTDTGIGITQEAQTRIFDSFVQADGSTTRSYGGSGLGLTISKQLVELMGGTLAVSSKEGEGSTFSFTVPRIMNEDSGSCLPPAQKSALVVSDHCSRLSVLSRMLDSWYYQVQGSTQLENVKGELYSHHMAVKPFDFILVDVDFQTRADRDFFIDYANQTGVPVVCLRESQTPLNRASPTFAFLSKFSDSTSLKKWLMKDRHTVAISLSNDTKHHLHSNKKPNFSILVVDDNRINQIVATGMLEPLGFTVEVAGNGKIALDMLEKNTQFAAILMDCHMPVMDGYEATQRYRERERAAGSNRIPILAMTAHTSSDDRKRCLDVGMDDYLSKPILLAELESKLSLWIPQYSTQSASTGKMAQENESLFNADKVNVLRKQLGKRYGILINAFCDNLRSYVEQLEEKELPQDTLAVREIALTLLGCAASVGSDRIVSLAMELDRAFATNNLEQVPLVIEKLDIAKSRLDQELSSMNLLSSQDDERVADKKAVVLVVDDDQSVRLIAKATLEPLGLDILEAVNGATALEICDQVTPDIVLMDATMPTMDGFETAHRILKQAREIPPSILLMTALHDDEYIHKAFDVGATDFIMKPLHLTLLRRRVEYLLQSRQAEQQVLHLTFRDPLTNLPNRTHFIDQLGEQVKRANQADSEFCVLSVNLDKLTNVNETFGNDFGDYLILQASHRIKKVLSKDDFFARTEGTKFMIILAGSTRQQSIDILVGELMKPYRLHGREYTLRINAGMVRYPLDGKGAEALIQYADCARAKAKAMGGNRLECFEQAHLSELDLNRHMEMALYKAIEQKEFTLLFQPRFSLHSDKPAGVEVLLRWNHSERGLLPFKEFYETANTHQLLDKIGLQLFSMLSDVLDVWGKQGLVAPPIFLPLVKDMFGPSILDTLTVLSDKIKCCGSHLTIQIVDLPDVAVSDVRWDVFKRIADLKIDFETECFDHYLMSLESIRTLPISSVIIYSGLVDNIHLKSVNQTIVNNLSNLAHELNMSICVKEVATLEQLDQLKGLGCDYAQGGCLGWPLPAKDVVSWFHDGEYKRKIKKG